jgi:hypothetical protein
MDDHSRSPRPAVILAAALITVSVMIILAELMSSEALIYRYRDAGVLTDGTISSVVLIKKAAAKLGWIEPDLPQFELGSIPSPFLREDPTFGWSASPGKYIHTFKRRRHAYDRWETLPVKVTINPDQSRWTGMPAQPEKPTIYVFGDSFAFGTGVNDEQTFAYHLQMARPHYNVKLFALAGYGLVQTYLNVQKLKSQISDRDILVIGYADYYDVRHVAAPSRLREIEQYMKEKNLPESELTKIPKAYIGRDDRLSIALAEQDCRVVRSYCDSDDPPLSEMTAVSLRLIHEIGRATDARTYLLYMRGRRDNPVVQKGGVEVISALQEDFGYFMSDDIVGFDSHPGPYWHYAIAQKLISRIE